MHGPPQRGFVNLPLIVLARLSTTVIFMTYPASLSVLMSAWRMSATQAGILQGTFSAAFALSLLVASYLADRVGAKRVFSLASALAALAAIAFACFARSFETALVTLALVGLTQGGTYTPAIMVVSANCHPAKKSAAIGWVLAGMSGGYVVSIALSATLVARIGYEAAFFATASVTVIGWVLAKIAIRDAVDGFAAPEAGHQVFTKQMRRRSRLLTLGYIGHCWELLGMWAWIPAFLAAAALTQATMTAVELGLWTALALHLSGFVASFLSGYAADRFGHRITLIGFALLGCLCSASIGWLHDLTLPLLLVLVAIYGFATIGDSAVLSSAMTDAVPPRYLGRVLGVRSVLGIGAGAVAPISFGFALDAFRGSLGWGLGFSTLALGGLVATVCALCLPRQLEEERAEGR